MFEPDADQKIKMIAGHIVAQGQCVDLGNEHRETKFQNGSTAVRFMRNSAGDFTSIALEDEARNVYAYWSEGYDVLFMLTEDGQEFNQLYTDIENELGICF